MTVQAQLLAAINGGAPTAGAQVAAAASTVQYSLASSVGVRQARFELWDVPAGFGLPAGWTLDTDGVTFFSTANPPQLITLPAIALWGNWHCRVRINGNPLRTYPDGTLDVNFNPLLTDETCAIEMLSPNGLHDRGYLEGTQFSASKADTAHEKANLRIIDALLGGGSLGAATLAYVWPSDANQALTAPQNGNVVFELTGGGLTAQRTFDLGIVPVGKVFFVDNQTTGGQAIRIGGFGPVLATLKGAWFRVNSAGFVKRMSADVTP